MLATLERPTNPTLRPLDFELTGELEATMPPEVRGLARDEVRLLVSYRNDGRVEHSQFTEFASFLEAGDLVVVNDSVTVLTQLGEPAFQARQLVDRAILADPKIEAVDTLVASALRLRELM